VAEVARAMKAERGTFFLVEPGTGHLVSVAGHFPELPRIRLEPGQGIAGHVVGTGRAVVLPRVEDDPRFCAAVDLLTYLVGPAVPAALRLGSGPMICAECGEESDEMTTVREDGK